MRAKKDSTEALVFLCPRTWKNCLFFIIYPASNSFWVNGRSYHPTRSHHHKKGTVKRKRNMRYTAIKLARKMIPFCKLNTTTMRWANFSRTTEKVECERNSIVAPSSALKLSRKFSWQYKNLCACCTLHVWKFLLISDYEANNWTLGLSARNARHSRLTMEWKFNN